MPDLKSEATESDDQVGSEDEYEISLADGIDDESLKDNEGSRKFSITSYGADYTVDGLVKRMNAEAFIIPKFQRRFVWSQKHASRFIESLLMGLPIPSIFLYKQNKTNKHLVIDGQQRLRTLQSYYKGLIGEKKFRLIGVMDPWNNKTYDELDPSDQLKIDDSIIHATIFQQDHPEDHTDSIYFVFERINSGGIRLSSQEIRNCINDGPFIDAVKILNNNQNWRKIFGPINKRAKDEEMIIRFFAMLKNGNKYTKPMASFLNDAADVFNKFDQNEIKNMSTLFDNTAKFIFDALGARAFRPSGVINAAVFDAIMPTVAELLQKSDPDFTTDKLTETYDRLLLDAEFMRACERATSDEEVLKKRVAMSRLAFGL